MSALVLYDDATARQFEPFSLTRPTSELRAGTTIIRRRWEDALGLRASGFVAGEHLADFEELDAPPVARGEIAAGTVIAQARFAPALAAAPADAGVWTSAGRVAAVKLDAAIPATTLRGGGATLESLAPQGADSREIEGWWIDEVWDLIRHLHPMITADVERMDGCGHAAPLAAKTTIS